MHHYDHRWVPTPNMRWHMVRNVVKAVRVALAHAVWPRGQQARTQTPGAAIANSHSAQAHTHDVAHCVCGTELGGFLCASRVYSACITHAHSHHVRHVVRGCESRHRVPAFHQKQSKPAASVVAKLVLSCLEAEKKKSTGTSDAG